MTYMMTWVVTWLMTHRNTAAPLPCSPAVFVCVLYNRPLALVGGVVTMKMWDWARSGGDMQGSTMFQFKYGAATILSWVRDWAGLLSVLGCSVCWERERARCPTIPLKTSRQADKGGTLPPFLPDQSFPVTNVIQLLCILQ
jgi:hypothetical protein